MRITVRQLKDIVRYAEAVCRAEDDLFPGGEPVGNDRLVAYEVPLYLNGCLEDEAPIVRLVDAGDFEDERDDRWTVEFQKGD